MSQDNKLYTGSICFTDLWKQMYEKHSAFQKGKNGKLYVNVSIWVNEHKDDFGNDLAIKLSKKKDSDDETPYIGNAKSQERQAPPPPSDNDLKEYGDLPDWAKD